MFGYHGRFLRVDLREGRGESRPLPEGVLRSYLGGVGLATYLLHTEAPVGVDPLAPEAPLVFALSPLVGTPLTTSAKFAVAAKSPLTYRLNDALSSSHFAIAAKRTGYDALVLAGRAPSLSVLVVDEDTVRLLPGERFAGQTASATETALRAELGPRFQFAAIGPAGERGVRYATVSHDNRHAGRGGLGAVMGAKNLKALAVAGGKRVKLAHPERVTELARDLSRRSFGPATAKYRELGTVANLLTFNRLGTLPTHNFQAGTFAGAESLSEEALQGGRPKLRQSCAACTVGCEHIFESSGGAVRLEYESLFALGPLCGVRDRDTVLTAAKLCDELGLDTISAGATVAFAMECAERGLIDEPTLRFGNGAALLETLEKIGRREGLGNLLAEGTRRAAEVIGGDAPDFAPHVKGLEIPGYEPRALQTMALGFAVGSRGADHNRSGAYEVDFSPGVDRRHGSPEMARRAVETEDRAALMDSLILCKFLRGVFTDLFAEGAELLGAVTGWDVDAEELHTAARRIVAAKKLYNRREGWTAAEDTLPARFLSEGLPSENRGETVLPRERLRAMIQAYYAARGWDEAGNVPPEQVAEFGLGGLSPMAHRP